MGNRNGEKRRKLEPKDDEKMGSGFSELGVKEEGSDRTRRNRPGVCLKEKRKGMGRTAAVAEKDCFADLLLTK